MLDNLLQEIKKFIPSYWPLQSIIATNPLYGLIDMPFDECLQLISQYTTINGSLKIVQYHDLYTAGKISVTNLLDASKEFLSDKNLDVTLSNKFTNLLLSKEFQQKIELKFRDRSNLNNILLSKVICGTEDNKVRTGVMKFMADFFDIGMAKWKMPVESNNLYSAWLEYSIVENKYIKSVINEVPPNSLIAIEYLLSKIGVSESLYQEYLLEIIFQILGWSSFVGWLERRPDNPYISKSASISDLLAIWLCHEYALCKEYNVFFKVKLPDKSKVNPLKLIFLDMLPEISSFPDSIFNMYSISLVWQRAIELNYQEQLLEKIDRNVELIISPEIADAQVVFCVDTRSEGLRRHLESMGNYQTYGFAGYFGVAFKLHDEETGEDSLQCPGIIKPATTLINKPEKRPIWKTLIKAIEDTFYSAKNAFLSPFILFDSIGLWYGINIAGRTLFPEKYNNIFPLKQTKQFSYQGIDVFSGFEVSDLANQLSQVLITIGLNRNFSKIVIICGHASQSENNPFQSAQDCGACGGNAGITNAIAFCQALNDVRVRKQLAKQYNIIIPDNTDFISACHYTTSDEIGYFNNPQKNNINQYDKVKHDFKESLKLLRKERAVNLLSHGKLGDRKTNWAQLVPELALANNASFIIAPRKLTQKLNLERRAFLQSYDPINDHDGSLLEAIFNSVLLVGHWINSQYYFSSTDKHIYGSGNKAIHNIVGHFGVVEGNFGDFKIGLTNQSVVHRDQLIFEPLRLLVIVYAKKESVDLILEKHPHLLNIFKGRWSHLKVIEPHN